jgi:hypothetical protein
MMKGSIREGPTLGRLVGGITRRSSGTAKLMVVHPVWNSLAEGAGSSIARS